MCDPVTAIMAAGTTLQVAGQLSQGRAAQRAANQQAGVYEYEALVEQDNALAAAQQIRRQGVADRGRLVAAVGASGVKIGQGSALDAERQVMQDYETDASMAILTGKRNADSLRTNAELTRQAGRDARRASNISAFSTLLQSGASGMRMAGTNFSGWDARGFSGTNDRSFVSTGNNMSWFLRNGTSGD